MSALPVWGQDSSGVRLVGRIYNNWDSANGVAVVGNYAYVAAGDSGLRIVDVTHLWDIAEVGFYDPEERVGAVAVSGSRAYLLVGNHELQVVDISDYAHPVGIGSFNLPGTACGIDISGDYAYVAAGDSGLRMVDIRDPTQPSQIGFHPAGASRVSVAGDYAYVIAEDLTVINISNPNRPVETGSIGTASWAVDVAIAGNHAYVVCEEYYSRNRDDYEITQHLLVVDVSAPNRPVIVGGCYLSCSRGGVYGVAVAGNYAYVADGHLGLRIVNVNDPANPHEVGFYDMPGVAHDVTIGPNGLIYISEGRLGIYDCSEAMSAPSDRAAEHPSSFCLNPAFPNPFNSITTISFDLPQASPLSVRVYDLSGREVATLADGYMKAGQYTAVWNAGGAASGEYIVKIEAPGLETSQKLTLIK